jgi:hypothetical protein
MNLARHIPILRNNPVFVLEAPRIWRRKTALIAGGAVVVGLTVAGGAVQWGMRQQPVASNLARVWPWRVSETCPELLAATGVWWSVASMRVTPGGPAAKRIRVGIALYALLAVLLALSRYVVPALIGGTIARARAQGADREMAVTRLPPRTVVSGIFSAAAWPLVLVWVALTAAFGMEVPGLLHRPITAALLVLAIPLDTAWVAANAGAVALAASALCRRQYSGPIIAVAAVVGVEVILMLARSHLAHASHEALLTCPVFCLAHAMTAAAAFWLAARLWRRPSVPAALAGLGGFLAVMAAISLLAPRRVERAEVAWLTRRLDSPSRGVRQDAALALRGHARWDASLRTAIVAGLMECLDDESPTIRADAADALREMGGSARPALPRLRAMRDDQAEDPSIRFQADRAVEDIEAASKAKPPPSPSPAR